MNDITQYMEEGIKGLIENPMRDMMVLAAHNAADEKSQVSVSEGLNKGPKALLRIERFDDVTPDKDLKDMLQKLAGVRRGIEERKDDWRLLEEETRIVRGIFRRAFDRRFEIANALPDNDSEYNKALNGVLDLYRKEGLNDGAKRAIEEELGTVKKTNYPT